MSSSAKRPAHRPSRRGSVVDAAMALFAKQAAETVTVADIAEQAGMTSAAVYYHYASKEHILLEGLQAFRTEFIAHVRQLVIALPPAGGDLGELMSDMTAWVEQHRSAATVYFSTSVGLNLAVEALRRDVRTEFVLLMQRAVRLTRGRISAADSGVIAVGLLVLLETSATAMLTHDPLRESLGDKRFGVEVGRTARRLAGAAERDES